VRNLSQPAGTNEPLPIQQQQVGNQPDQSVNTSAVPEPPTAATPSGPNQYGEQQQGENPLSKFL
jgi:hypothetical protein